MLIHEALQEQLVRERKQRFAALDASEPQPRPARQASTPSFVRSLVPAFTHGLFGIPAPPRAAGGGC